jgi:hypothetical protein
LNWNLISIWLVCLQVPDGYRDIKLFVAFRGGGGLGIIGEIQVLCKCRGGGFQRQFDLLIEVCWLFLDLLNQPYTAF